MWSVTLLLLLFSTVLEMFVNKYLVKFLLAILTNHHLHLLLSQIVNINFLYIIIFFLFLIFLHSFNSWPKIFRGSFPILSSFSLIESFTSSHSHFLLLFSFSLFDYLCLSISINTCYFPTLLAYELNSFLFDIKTNLQALACFSKAFLLNFLPHPSGHNTKSFSLSGGNVYSCYSSWIGFY